MRPLFLISAILLLTAGPDAAAQDTAAGSGRKPGPELSEAVTLKPQVAVPRCTGYWLVVVNRTDHPLHVSIGKVYLGTAAPDGRGWSFRIPSEMADLLPARGITFRSVGGPPPEEQLLWDEFRVYCGR